MSTIEIEWENLDRMLQAMVKVGGQSKELENYFDAEVCNPSGFDYEACALKPIADQIGKLSGYFGDMRGVFAEHWRGTTEAIIDSAREIDQTDDAVSADFTRYLGIPSVGSSTPPTQNLPALGVDVESFVVKDLDLPAPGEGTDTMKHDPDWNMVSDGYDACRDTINSGIDRINGLGAPGVHLDRLSDKSLEDYIVYPLSGNYLKIQGNAEACDNVGSAMSEWGTNFSIFSAKVTAALRGEVSGTLILHLNVYNLVMKAVGSCIDAGSVVFTEIAKVSEKIAVAVEKALVLMGKTLLRVSKKIASRVLGWIGWATLAADIIKNGFSAITDIYDDVMACVHIITACSDLVETIKAWAEEAAAKLKTFEKLMEIVRSLPGTSSGGLDGLPPVHVHVVEDTLADITYGNETGGPKSDGLDDALDDLGAQAEEEAPDLGDYDEDDEDDEMLMAPGPLGEPTYGDSSTSGMQA